MSPTPARKVDQLRDELFDPRIPKNELWLARARKEIETAYKAGLVAPAEYHDLMGVSYGAAIVPNLDLAVKHGRDAVRIDPEPAFVFNLAVSLTNADLAEEAIHLLEGAVLDPATELYCLLAEAYTCIGRWKTARRMYRAAVALADRDDPDQLQRLAAAAENVGLYDEAVRLAARYLARRIGVDANEAEELGLAFILECPDEVRDAHSEVLPTGSIRRALARVTKHVRARAAGPELAAAAVAAAEVFEDWSQTREEATSAVLDV